MPDQERYAFDGWTVDVSERRLRSARQAVTLPPKAYDLLVTLVRNAGRARIGLGGGIETHW
jgi:DNA-binding response OmpR family regulator